MIFKEQYNYNTITAYHIVIQYNSQYNSYEQTEQKDVVSITLCYTVA